MYQVGDRVAMRLAGFCHKKPYDAGQEGLVTQVGPIKGIIWVRLDGWPSDCMFAGEQVSPAGHSPPSGGPN